MTRPLVRVLLRDLDRETWYHTSGPTIASELGGMLLEDVYAPGLLYGFPKAISAARAALRFFAEARRGLPGGIMPATVIDVAGADAKRMASVAFGLKPEFIAVTADAAQLLAGEPIQFLLGPVVPLEGGMIVDTKLIPTSSHNLGWALPSVPLGEPSPAFGPHAGLDSARYGRRQEPAVINIHMEQRRWLPRVPWKFIGLIGVLLVGLWMAFAVTKFIVSKGRGTHEAARATAEEESLAPIVFNAVVEKPIPPGFGTVVIETEPTEGVKISLDKVVIGKKSPVVLEKKSNQNTYELVVEKKGYETYTNLFNVEANERKLIKVRLAKVVPQNLKLR